MAAEDAGLDEVLTRRKCPKTNVNTFKEHVVLGNIFTSFRGQFFSCGAIAFVCTFFVFIHKHLSDTQHTPDTALDTMGKITRRKDRTYWAFTMFVLGICSLHRH